MRHPPSTPLLDRLIAGRRIDPVTNCWLWTGALDRYGYGKMKWKGILVKTHRASLHHFKGMALDDPQFACHTCDTPACFNPDHLEPGSPSENFRHIFDRSRASRAPNGQIQKLTPISDLPF